MIYKAIAFSQSSNYTQIKAKSWVGLGCIERQAGNFQAAHNYHQQAVELLDQITAKCDLAEAYFQWGITAQRDRTYVQNNQYFQQAIVLYQQIQAPKQLERINLIKQ